ncbi:MAG: futalosine hydrolase [Leptolyngbya sp. PLA1]|nr:futalosine hydrolase [Leptolyngbya sp. PLA1]
MTQGLRSVANGRGLVLVVAAPLEAGAVLAGLARPDLASPVPWSRLDLGHGVSLITTGVGKAAAAGACGALLRPQDGVVLNVGVAGTLPGTGLRLGAVVAASTSVFADEGVETPEGFVDIAAAGFPPGDVPGVAMPCHAGVVDALRPVADAVAPIATVSTCSGTDVLAREIERRTGAVAEGMEGAAVVLVCRRLGVPAGELRVISNTTGDRASQVWDMPGALAVLSRVIGLLSLGWQRGV